MSEIGSWLGKPMMNPQGKIGKVIKDSNGVYRILTVKFDDESIEKLWLNNLGSNPIESRKWKWWFESRKDWVEWGV